MAHIYTIVTLIFCMLDPYLNMHQLFGHHIYTKSNVDKIESIQRCAVRFVVADYDYSSCVTSILNRLKEDK